MSALVGLRLAHGDRDEDRIGQWLAAMPYRAPDGVATFSKDNVSLGLGYMRVLAEDPPGATVFQSQDVALVADARLDNRDELINELSLSGQPAESDILLAAYQRWGEDCVRHLLGDFAFIVYDHARNRLMAARDHLGVKPLFYRDDATGLALASEFRVLVAPGAPFDDLSLKGPLPAHLADFVAHRVTEDHAVVYEGLLRLPPGHILISDGHERSRLQRYWQPVISPVADQSPAAFRVLFEEAVRCRMRSVTPVAALMSGGLDSTSIACCAAQIREASGGAPLDTFSVVFDATPDLNERPFIEAALPQSKFHPRFVPLDNYAPFAGFEALLETQCRLFAAPGLRMTSLLINKVREEGFRVILDGHGGDEVVSHGFGRLHELAGFGRWREVWRETAAWSRLYGTSRLKVFCLLFLRHGRFKGAYHLRRAIGRWQKRFGKADVNLLGPRLQAFTAPSAAVPQDEAAEHLAFLSSAMRADVFEILELAAAAAGTELRFPFFDRRLVEFCLALPSEAKLNNGWGRYILRQAMAGILPEKVRWRASKFDFTPHVAAGNMKHHEALIESVIEGDMAGVSAYVNLETMRPIFRRARKMGARTRGADVQAIWRTVALALWLKANGKTS